MSEEKWQETIPYIPGMDDDSLTAKYKNLINPTVQDTTSAQPPELLKPEDVRRVLEPKLGGSIADMVRDWFAQRDLMIESLQQRRLELIKELSEVDGYLKELGIGEQTKEEKEAAAYDDVQDEVFEEVLENDPTLRTGRKRPPLKEAPRLRILNLLDKSSKSLTIDNISRSTHIAKPVVKDHLYALKKEGLVTQANKYWKKS